MWNRFDFAKDVIFVESREHPVAPVFNKEEVNNKSESKHKDLEMESNWTAEQKLSTKGLVKLMQFAVENDRQEFIREFLHRKNFVKRWLTVEQLLCLYKNLQNVILEYLLPDFKHIYRFKL